MKRRLPVTVETGEKEPHTDQNEPPKKKKKKKNPHKRELITADEDQLKTAKVTSLSENADTESHNGDQKKKKKKDKKKQHEEKEEMENADEGRKDQKKIDKKLVTENNTEVVMKVGEEDTEDGEAGSMNESHVDDWTKEQCLLLVDNIRQRIPEKDVMMYKTRALHLPWQEIIVSPFTEEQCRAKYKDLITKVRHYRTLEEVLQDVETDLNNPKQERKKAQDIFHIKKPISAYNRFVKDKIGSMTQKGTDKFRILAAEYKELSEDNKQKYVEEYNKEKKVYDEEMAKLKQSHPELFKSAKKSSKRSSTSTITKTIKPKYIEAVDLYVQSQVDKKKEENPQCDVHSTEEKYKKRWESLDETKKEKWIKKAETSNKNELNELEKFQEENPDMKFTKSEKRVIERLQGRPDKPLTAYNIFTIENLCKMTDIPNNERMKEVGQRWRALNDEEREAYHEKGRQAKMEYDKKYKEFLDRLTPEEREKELAPKSSKTPKKKKSSQGPISAMMFFINEKKDEYAAEHPTMEEKEIARYLYLEYKNLSEEQKAKYTAMEEAQYTGNTNQTKITKYFSSSFCSSAEDEQSTTKTTSETLKKEKQKKKVVGKDKSNTKIVKSNSHLVTSTPLTKSKKLTSKHNDVFELKSDSSSESDSQKSLQKVKNNKGKKIQNTVQRKSVETSSDDDSDSESDSSSGQEGKNTHASKLNVKSKTKPKHDSSSDSDSDSEAEKPNNKNVKSKRQSPQKVLHKKGEPMVNNHSSDSDSSSDEEVAKTVKTGQSQRKLPSPVKPVKDVSESSSSSDSESSNDEDLGVKEQKMSPTKTGTQKRASPGKSVTEKKLSPLKTKKLNQSTAKPSVTKKHETSPHQEKSSSESSDSVSESSSDEENVESKGTGKSTLNKVTNSVKSGKTNQSKLSQVQTSKSQSPAKSGKPSPSLSKSLPSTSSSKGDSDKLSQDLFSGQSDSDESETSSDDDEEEKDDKKKTITKSLPPVKASPLGNMKTNVTSKKDSSDDSSGSSSDSDASTSSSDSD